MATEQDITTFYSGEDIVIELFAKDDDGAALAAPANEEITIVIERRGTVALRENGSPQVVLTDAGTAHWTIRLDATNDLAGVIVPGVAYTYAIWSENSTSNIEYLQATGRLTYQPAPAANA